MGKFPHGYHVVHNPYKRTLTESEVMKFIEEEKPDGIIAGVEPLTREVLKNASTVKVISRCGVGLDSIDLEAAEEFGIKVFNTPDEVIQSVSEMAISLALSLLRHIPNLDSAMKKSKWSKIRGNLLSGKTIGIVGCGRIGSTTANLFSAFGCRVLCFDPYLTNHAKYELVDLPTLLEYADIVSLHLPSTPKTMGFVDTGFLSKMKKSALLINTARGSLVNEEDLYFALKNSSIAGAGIDVFQNEPYFGKFADPAIADKVVLTPHVSSNTLEGRMQMEMRAVDNLSRGLE